MRRHLPRLGLVLAGVAFLAACDAAGPDATGPAATAPAVAPHSAVAAPGPAASVAGTDGAMLATLRRVTARYQRIDVAEADGFIPVTECVEEEGLGGMGVHYARLDWLNDGVVDVEAPDVLLYEPTRNGRMRLVGAEFVVWRSDWGDPPGPVFLGQEFDHSFGEHAHGLPDHYELHLWIWRDNPSGLMAPFNPNVSCP